MADGAFDPALLDALALCYAEAAVRALIAANEIPEDKLLIPLENRKSRAKRGPELLTAAGAEGASPVVAPVADPAARDMVQVL